MKNIESFITKPVSVLTTLTEPYKLLNNKDTYVESVDPEKGRVVIYKTIDPERVERKSGTPVKADHFFLKHVLRRRGKLNSKISYLTTISLTWTLTSQLSRSAGPSTRKIYRQYENSSTQDPEPLS